MLRSTLYPGFAAIILCTSLILSACGGGGGSSSSTTNTSGGAATTLKAGLYEAKILYVNGAPTKAATTYLSPTGNFAAVFGGSGGLTLGNLAFANMRINGTSQDYRQLDPGQPDPKGFFEDKGAEQGVITGTITSQESATFSTADALGQVSTSVTLQRVNSLSDLVISLGNASGTYVSRVEGQSDVSLTVNGNGSLYSEYYRQATGCVLQGTETVSIPDNSINVFNITYTMSSCNNDNVNRNGEYSGVGFFGPMQDQSMRMVFAADNGTVAMRFDGVNK